MSLTNEDRKIMKQLHLDKAHVCLSDGEQLLGIGSISAAANRFYYAVKNNNDTHLTCGCKKQAAGADSVKKR